MRKQAGFRVGVAVVVGVGAAVGCAGPADPGGGAEPAVVGTTGVLAGEITAAAPDAVRRLRAREVADFLSLRTRGWRVVDRRRTAGGTDVDYVAAETLYPDSPMAPFAPPPPHRPTSVVDGTGRGLSELQADPALRPPPGTVAVLRPRFDHYLSGASRARTLAEFLDEHPKPAPSFVNDRLYNTHRDGRANIGTGAAVNLWDYQAVASGEMSLIQTASLCFGSSPATTLESIEVGFQKLPSMYGDSNVHFFTYFRTAGGASGARVGGYNLDVAGFIQAVGAPFAPGAGMNTGTFSTVGGTQYECAVETELFQGNWWVFACGSWVGYYPTMASTSVSASQKIDFDLIGTGACMSDWYGEAYDPTPTTWTSADMGSGRFPSEGYGRAAYIREPWVQLTATTADWLSSAVPATGNGYDPDCYALSSIFQNGGVGWARWFYLGGPGGDNPGCN